MNAIKIKPRSSDTSVSVLFNISADFDEVWFYIPAGYNLKFEKVINTFTHIGVFLENTEENLYEKLTSDYNLELYPYVEEIVNLIKKYLL